MAKHSHGGHVTPKPAPTTSPTPPIQTLIDLQMLPGNPSNATADDPNNYLIQRTQYSLSYSRDRGRPNWVSWHLSRATLGAIRRTGKFLIDTSLPAGWYRVDPRDYSQSGYNRGHMCPSEHRTRTIPDNMAVFLMTNILPQASGNDEGPWVLLENYTRDLALQGNDLFLVAGGDGSLGTLHDQGKVAIPAHTWYVILVSPTPVTSPQEITAAIRPIAMRLPNDNTVATSRWQDFRVSIADVEKATGYTFLSAVPPAVAKQLKARVDDQ